MIIIIIFVFLWRKQIWIICLNICNINSHTGSRFECRSFDAFWCGWNCRCHSSRCDFRLYRNVSVHLHWYADICCSNGNFIGFLLSSFIVFIRNFKCSRKRFKVYINFVISQSRYENTTLKQGGYCLKHFVLFKKRTCFKHGFSSKKLTKISILCTKKVYASFCLSQTRKYANIFKFR